MKTYNIFGKCDKYIILIYRVFFNRVVKWGILKPLELQGTCLMNQTLPLLDIFLPIMKWSSQGTDSTTILENSEYSFYGSLTLNQQVAKLLQKKNGSWGSFPAHPMVSVFPILSQFQKTPRIRKCVNKVIIKWCMVKNNLSIQKWFITARLYKMEYTYVYLEYILLCTYYLIRLQL